MTVRSLFSFANAYYMQWVSNKVVSDIRVQLFTKIVRHSMDFFNKMRSGFSCRASQTTHAACRRR